MRKRLEPVVAAGRAVCWRCGGRIEAGSEWHLGHSDDGRRWLGAEHARCNLADGGRRGYRTMIARATGAVPAVTDGRRAAVPSWRASYPADWPPDPDAANQVSDWSQHWDVPGVFNPRCGACRRLGRACEDADSEVA